MAALSEQIERNLRGEVAHFRSLIKTIEEGDTSFGNAQLCDPDWNTPTIGMGIVPFNDPRGVLFYYHSMIKGIEKAIETGKVPNEYAHLFRRAPDYIKVLVEDSGPFIA